MTGYGKTQACCEGKRITLEIKSVNSRYLDISVKYPRLFAFLEEPIKKMTQKFISRGKVDVYVSIDFSEAETHSVSLNRPLLESYLEVVKTLSEQYTITSDLSAADILRIPDVLTSVRREEDEVLFLQAVSDAFADALAAHDQMRRREGASMEADIAARLAALHTYLAQIEARAPLSVAQYREKLTARIAELLQDVPVDEQRIITETAYFADKVSVAEEIVRLHSHFAQCARLLQEQAPVGRKLDFLVQELNREVNTIGSKCTDVEITRLVLEMKAEIEKIREQTQNIE